MALKFQAFFTDFGRGREAVVVDIEVLESLQYIYNVLINLRYFVVAHV